MLDQNTTVANLDYEYYDNPNDQFRPGVGSLLPLWKLFQKEAPRSLVTCLSWNTHYTDLFAIGFRERRNDKGEDDADVENDHHSSLEPGQQVEESRSKLIISAERISSDIRSAAVLEEYDLGLMREKGRVCILSLKGPSYPEKIYHCLCGVTSVAFHPSDPRLVAVGFAGGTLAIYDLKWQDATPRGLDTKFNKCYHFDLVGDELWFRQDGATCHTARATIDLLKDTLGDRLISRFGPVNWPPRSCDLTPLDYFLWGYVKSLVYADKPQTLDHLEDDIRRVIADIRPQMLEKVIENWTSRLDYIRGSRMPEIIFKM
ncbi:dynein intermediate chain 1, axonemal [Trichonephila clavipes]|nr:dynein intermediate chain 1, axonemal [Trichonephila clavipes]